MPRRRVQSANERMIAASRALEDCQRSEPKNLAKIRAAIRDLRDAVNAYAAAVDDYLARVPQPDLPALQEKGTEPGAGRETNLRAWPGSAPRRF